MQAKPITGFSLEPPDSLYGEVGHMKMEFDWFKKVQGQPVMTRYSWIGVHAELCKKASAC